MLILGIESSCDETAAAIVEDGRLIRSSVIASQHDLHAEFRGVVPELASRAHAERILPIIRAALRDANVSLADLDAIAVGNRPGLIGSLLVGVAAAKALAWALDSPLIAVDHVHAHLYSGLLQPPAAAIASSTFQHSLDDSLPLSPPHLLNSSPAHVHFPSLGLVVSGGHTSLYRLDSPTSLRRIGSTIDDALGEAFDKAATILGLPYPGGPNLDRLAQTPGANPRAHEFPISRLAPDSLDFSFSGLKTSLLYRVRGLPEPGGVFTRDHAALSLADRADLAASFQHAAVKAVIIKIERALDRWPSLAPAGNPSPRALLVGGGVCANSSLRNELARLTNARGLRLVLPPLSLCVDNAAMIAGLAFHLHAAGQIADLDLQAYPATGC
ncbi:MAG: tRNA (adenosine(37)-N6)-threonylcarbamoyltransferase complex transferase subunit TsaD [Phycisphaerales bacterium]